jgi:hypothetical protein
MEEDKHFKRMRAGLDANVDQMSSFGEKHMDEELLDNQSLNSYGFPKNNLET